MKKTAIAAISAAALACASIGASSLFAQAAPQAPGQMDASRVTAGTYALDPAHTLVQWRLDHFGFNDYFGLFGNISGTMTLDPANVEAATFDISIPIADVTVASAGLKDHLLRPGKDGAKPDFFGPNPGMAKFTSTNVRRLDDDRAVVSGMLDMNGRSGPVTMLVEFSGAGTNPMNKKSTVGFHANAVIDRTQWGLDYAAGMLGNDVALTITAAFEQTEQLASVPAVNGCFDGRSGDFVGKPVTDALRNALSEASNGKFRIYTVGDPVTADYRPDRLNVVLAADGRVQSLGCG